MAVTIKDIAQAAGVSRGTVDRVLNGRGKVRPQVAEKVRRLAREMNYLPNRAGRELAAIKRSLRIGFLLPGVDNGFFDDILRGARAGAAGGGYHRSRRAAGPGAPHAGALPGALLLL